MSETNTEGILNWHTSIEEAKLIDGIINRAFDNTLWGRLLNQYGYERGTVVMDITACHLNGNPLDLQAMLTGPDSDFIHDVTGIVGHIDRGTGKLLDCFVPRFTKREAVAS